MIITEFCFWSGCGRTHTIQHGSAPGGSHTQTVTLSQGARVRDTIMSLVRPHEALTDRGLSAEDSNEPWLSRVLTNSGIRMAPKGNCKFLAAQAFCWMDTLSWWFLPAQAVWLDCMNQSRGVRINFNASEQIRPSCWCKWPELLWTGWDFRSETARAQSAWHRI